ncbi:HAMP domain-containing histidine kinase [Streptomyces tubbatahanensis]|uniref:histidine kinase n=1 Tax=Streptomyces tubbatahanensis TaxID=2923272 RepID=A0ABY3XX12_9ACTN|nr:HAMP domain-containing sensor histidine kinase [Streptomyces tubbatahanensis]UNS99044.1 HAMP domain-containing histidine kinase [Streptomyces tubbatahanensis]
MSGERRRLSWRRRRPLRTRLALAATAAVALVAVGVCAAAFVVIRYELLHQVELNLTQSASRATQEVRQNGDAPRVLSADCRYLAAPACAQVVAARPEQDPRGRESYRLPVDETAREVAAGEREPYYSAVTVHGRPARMLTTPLGEGRALQVALRSDTVREGVRQAALLLAAVGAAGVLVAAGLGFWVSRTGLAPVARLTATAERITRTRDAGHRIALPPGGAQAREDELSRLAASFNTMLGALEQSVAAQRRLVADASHELRTPLTALRTNTELLARADRLTPAQRERASAALGRQLREVTALVNDLIELARDEEPQPLVEQVELVALVRHAVAEARGHWPTTAFALHVAPAAEGAAVPGVPARLTRLLTNLLDNAAKFSDGTVESAVLAVGDATEITVRDHGPGLAPEDLPHVFDRFYRAEAARALPGSGLGLAMAQQIARAHGARLTAERPEGGGALFRLRFGG